MLLVKFLLSLILLVISPKKADKSNLLDLKGTLTTDPNTHNHLLTKRASSISHPIPHFNRDPNLLIFDMLKGHLSISDLLELRLVSKSLAFLINPLIKVAKSKCASSLYPNLVVRKMEIPDNVIKDLEDATKLIPFSSITVSDWRLLQKLPVTKLYFLKSKLITSEANLNDAKKAFSIPSLNEIVLGPETFDSTSKNVDRVFSYSMSDCKAKVFMVDSVTIDEGEGSNGILDGFSDFIRNSDLQKLSLVNFRINSWTHIADSIIRSKQIDDLEIIDSSDVPNLSLIQAASLVLSSNKLRVFKYHDIVSSSRSRVTFEISNDYSGFMDGLRKATWLESLDLAVWCDGEEVSLANALQKLSNLKSFRLNCYGQGAAPYMKLLMINLASLQKLETLALNGGMLSASSFTAYFAYAIKRLQNLKSLEVGEIAEHRFVMITNFITKYCPSLAEFRFTVKSESPSAKSIESLLQVAKKVKSLAISNFNVDLSILSKHIGNLENLEIHTSYGFFYDIEGWTALLEAVKESSRMESFSVSFIDIPVDPYHMLAMLQGAKKLFYLRINGIHYEPNLNKGMFQRVGGLREPLVKKGSSLRQILDFILGF